MAVSFVCVTARQADGRTSYRRACPDGRLLSSGSLCDLDAHTRNREVRVSFVTRVGVEFKHDSAAPGTAWRQHADPVFA